MSPPAHLKGHRKLPTTSMLDSHGAIAMHHLRTGCRRVGRGERSPDDLQLCAAAALAVLPRGAGALAAGHVDGRDVGRRVGVRVMVERVVPEHGATGRRRRRGCLHGRHGDGRHGRRGAEDHRVADDRLGIRAAGARTAGGVGEIPLCKADARHWRVMCARAGHVGGCSLLQAQAAINRYPRGRKIERGFVCCDTGRCRKLS